MDRYEFSMKNNKMTCKTKINGETVNYFDDDARFIILQLGHDKYDRVNLDKTDKKKPSIRLTNDVNTVIFRDCLDNKNTLNEYFVNNRPKINSLIDEENKARTKVETKKLVVKGIAVTVSSVCLFAMQQDGFDFDFNRETSALNSGKKIISMEEDVIDTSKDSFDVGEDTYVVEDTSLKVDDYSDSSNYIEVREKYSSLCEEIGGKYGVSPELLVAMITQESGGKYRNLMQIEFDNCSDEVFSVDNFVTGEKDKFVLTNNKDKYDPSIIVIDSEMINDPYYNVLMGCVILQNASKDFDGNLLMAIQGYNYGIGNMYKVLNKASKDLGVSVESLIDDKDGKDWLKYRKLNVGDNNYIENVCRYLGNGIDNIFINNFSENNNLMVRKK